MKDGALEIRGDVYADDMKKSLKRLSELTKKDARELVKERASTMARYLAEWTMPVAGIAKGSTGKPDGKSKRAQTLGMNAVSRDIGRVYMDIKYLKKHLEGRRVKQENQKSIAVWTLFQRFIQQGNLDKAQKIIRTTPKFTTAEVMHFDGGKLHRKSQRNGRVHENQKPKIVIDSPKLREYVKKERENVGWTKGAWIKAGRMVNGKNGLSAKWITKHNPPARGQFKIMGAIGEAVLNNAVPWVDKKLHDVGAMEAFDRSIKKDIDKRIIAIMAKEQRQK